MNLGAGQPASLPYGAEPQRWYSYHSMQFSSPLLHTPFSSVCYHQPPPGNYPPHHFLQQNPYPPPGNYPQPNYYPSPHHFPQQNPYPPPLHFAELNSYPPPPTANPYSVYAYQPHFIPTNQLVPPPHTTHEPTPNPQLYSVPLQPDRVTDPDVPVVDSSPSSFQISDARLDEFIESVNRLFDNCIAKCRKGIRLSEGSSPSIPTQTTKIQSSDSRVSSPLRLQTITKSSSPSGDVQTLSISRPHIKQACGEVITATGGVKKRRQWKHNKLLVRNKSLLKSSIVSSLLNNTDMAQSNHTSASFGFVSGISITVPDFNFVDNGCDAIDFVFGDKLTGIGVPCDNEKRKSSYMNVQMQNRDDNEFSKLEVASIKEDEHGPNLYVNGIEFCALHLLEKMSKSDGRCSVGGAVAAVTSIRDKGGGLVQKPLKFVFGRDSNTLNFPTEPTSLCSPAFVKCGVSVGKDKSKFMDDSRDYGTDMICSVVNFWKAWSAGLKHYIESSKRIGHYALLLHFSGFDKRVRDKGSGHHPLLTVLHKEFTAGNVRLLWLSKSVGIKYIRVGDSEKRPATVLQNDVNRFIFGCNMFECVQTESSLCVGATQNSCEYILNALVGDHGQVRIKAWENARASFDTGKLEMKAIQGDCKLCYQTHFVHLHDKQIETQASDLHCFRFIFSIIGVSIETIVSFFSWKDSLCIVHKSTDFSYHTLFEPHLSKIATLTCSPAHKLEDAINQWEKGQGYQLILDIASLRSCLLDVSIQSNIIGGMVLAILLSTVPLIREQYAWLQYLLGGSFTRMSLLDSVHNIKLWEFLVLLLQKVETYETLIAALASSLEKVCSSCMINGDLNQYCKRFDLFGDRLNAVVWLNLDSGKGIGLSIICLLGVTLLLALKAFGLHQFTYRDDDYAHGWASLLNHLSPHVVGSSTYGSKDDYRIHAIDQLAILGEQAFSMTFDDKLACQCEFEIQILRMVLLICWFNGFEGYDILYIAALKRRIAKNGAAATTFVMATPFRIEQVHLIMKEGRAKVLGTLAYVAEVIEDVDDSTCLGKSHFSAEGILLQLHCDGIMAKFLKDSSSDQIVRCVKPSICSCCVDLTLIMTLYNKWVCLVSVIYMQGLAVYLALLKAFGPHDFHDSDDGYVLRWFLMKSCRVQILTPKVKLEDKFLLRGMDCYDFRTYSLTCCARAHLVSAISTVM